MTPEQQEFLEELYEFLDNRADVAADCSDGTTPNAEARLLDMMTRVFPEVTTDFPVRVNPPSREK